MASTVNMCSVEKQYNEHSTIANELQKANILANRKIGEKQGKLSRTRWWLKQLIPHTDWGIYACPVYRTRLVIWKSWLGKQTVLIDIPLKR